MKNIILFVVETLAPVMPMKTELALVVALLVTAIILVWSMVDGQILNPVQPMVTALALVTTTLLVVTLLMVLSLVDFLTPVKPIIIKLALVVTLLVVALLGV